MSDTSILLPLAADRASATLLCVDDEQNILSALRRLFRHDGTVY